MDMVYCTNDITLPELPIFIVTCSFLVKMHAEKWTNPGEHVYKLIYLFYTLVSHSVILVPTDIGWIAIQVCTSFMLHIG